MIGGVDWQDHNANLEATLKRIEDPYLTMHKKCEFEKTTMTSTKIEQDSHRRENESPKSREKLISFILKPLWTSASIIPSSYGWVNSKEQLKT